MGSVHGGGEERSRGLRYSSTAMCELNSDEVGQGLLARSVIAGFTDDKLVLNELNQIFTPVTKWDSPPRFLKRPGGYEGEGGEAVPAAAGSPRRWQAALPAPRSLGATVPVRQALWTTKGRALATWRNKKEGQKRLCQLTGCVWTRLVGWGAGPSEGVVCFN